MSFVIHFVSGDGAARAAVERDLAERHFHLEFYVTGEEFLREARLGGGCILIDQDLPAPGAGAVFEALVRRRVVLPVLLLRGAGDLGEAGRALKLAAVACVDRPVRGDELLAAVDRAEALFRTGESRRAAAAAARAKLERLSRREGQILEGLVDGLSNKAIARELGLSPRTVEMHRANMMAELGVATLPEALRLAIEGGVARAGDEALAPLEAGAPPVLRPRRDEPGPAGEPRRGGPALQAEARQPTRLDLLFRFSRERG